MYGEQASAVPGTVRWRGTGSGPDHDVRVLPDGCMDLIWSDRGGLLVAGPDTVAHLATRRDGETTIGLRFPPGTGPAVFGLPAHELRDRRVPLSDLWPAADVRRLAGLAARSPYPGRVLEAAALDRLRAGPGADPVAGEVAARLRAGESVAATAAAVGLGERLLHRRSRTLFGYGPKTLARILRMQRALALVDAGRPAAEVAATSGYADQAHLSREVRALAGVPLGVLRPRPPVR
ncbi:helix-turn-helix transcriptional regulator [Polymorphospora rubra]|uniref:AraC family transcriptional regulator n=1 Tax=Polymorphospora rubra TaxID=338584 RepID=A0A810NC38_9ACTN|nr:helix-turn-helix transcriptional regulator [Polymorphospora rubra]BCJ69914.1 AraC family transcriptional regulator [Polymorphospora rubra]